MICGFHLIVEYLRDNGHIAGVRQKWTWREIASECGRTEGLFHHMRTKDHGSYCRVAASVQSKLAALYDFELSWPEWKRVPPRPLPSLQEEKAAFEAFKTRYERHVAQKMAEHGPKSEVALASTSIEQLLALHISRDSVSPEAAGGALGAPDVDDGRLPTTFASKLFGRRRELDELTAAWESRATNIITYDAVGGAGKTALVSHFLKEMRAAGWRGAQRVFAWSFFSQGAAEDRQVGTHDFFDAALRFFSHDRAVITTEYDKGLTLARLIRGQRALIILDGIEPLQYGSGHRSPISGYMREGELKDQAIRTMIRALAVENDGLCIVTSRLPIAELREYSEPAVISRPLDRLAVDDGIDLLRDKGVGAAKGGNEADWSSAARQSLTASQHAEFAALVDAMEGHALALSLVATWLVDYFGGDLRPWRTQLPGLLQLETAKERSPYAAMRAHETALAREASSGSAEAATELSVLYGLSLFDRPVAQSMFDVLGDPPRPPSPLGPLGGIDAVQLERALTSLRRRGLLSSTANGVGTMKLVDAHPLVRSFFAERFLELSEVGYLAAHKRLFEYYRLLGLPENLRAQGPYSAMAVACAFPSKAYERYRNELARGNLSDWHRENTPQSLLQMSPDEIAASFAAVDLLADSEIEAVFLPQTREALAPLFQAVRHGCAAHEETAAFEDVYWPRILRGEYDDAARRLGMVAEDLSLLANFFEMPFSVVSPRLQEKWSRHLIGTAGFRLMSLGRLEEAVGPLQTAFSTAFDDRDADNFASVSANLCGTLLRLGLTAGENATNFYEQLAPRIKRDLKVEEYGAVFYARLADHIAPQCEPYRRSSLMVPLIGALLHGHGISAAETQFVAAEEVHIATHPTRPRLPYGDCLKVLIGRGRYVEAAYRSVWGELQHAHEGSLTNVAVCQAALAQCMIADRKAYPAKGAALAASRTAVLTARTAGVEEFLADALLVESEVAWREGEIASAIRAAEEAMELAMRGPMPHVQIDVHLLRGRIALRGGDRETAERERESANQMLLEYQGVAQIVEMTMFDAELSREKLRTARTTAGLGWWRSIDRIAALGANVTKLRRQEQEYNDERDRVLFDSLYADLPGYDMKEDPIAHYFGLWGPQDYLTDSMVADSVTRPDLHAAIRRIMHASGMPGGEPASLPIAEQRRLFDLAVRIGSIKLSHVDPDHPLRNYWPRLPVHKFKLPA